MEYFNEINSLEYLFLVDLKNLPANRLSIVVKEATISEQKKDMIIGGKNLGAVNRILSNGPGKEYELFFENYGAYLITNESFATFIKDDKVIGRLFCIYSTSHYMDYICENSLVNYTYDYENALKHYRINCQDHVIDIIAKDEPIIKRT